VDIHLCRKAESDPTAADVALQQKTESERFCSVFTFVSGENDILVFETGHHSKHGYLASIATDQQPPKL
jgi:hypothetical protein